MSGLPPRRGKSLRPEIKPVRKVPRPLLEIDTLSIRRDGTQILREVDWSVRRGEHWVILGPNGSGKTSLLAALTGYFMPTSGDLT